MVEARVAALAYDAVAAHPSGPTFERLEAGYAELSHLRPYQLPMADIDRAARYMIEAVRAGRDRSVWPVERLRWRRRRRAGHDALTADTWDPAYSPILRELEDVAIAVGERVPRAGGSTLAAHARWVRASVNGQAWAELVVDDATGERGVIADLDGVPRVAVPAWYANDGRSRFIVPVVVDAPTVFDDRTVGVQTISDR